MQLLGYKTSLLAHVASIRRCLVPLGLEARINFQNLVAFVSGHGHQYCLQPQYIQFIDGKASYIPEMTEYTHGFIGWLPYSGKRWSTGAGKRAFKDFCSLKKLRIPGEWPSPERADAAPGLSEPLRRPEIPPTHSARRAPIASP